MGFRCVLAPTYLGTITSVGHDGGNRLPYRSVLFGQLFELLWQPPFSNEVLELLVMDQSGVHAMAREE